MKKHFLAGILLLALLSVAATTYTIDQLTNNSTPSNGTVIEVYDPSASPKSGKYTLTNKANATPDGITNALGYVPVNKAGDNIAGYLNQTNNVRAFGAVGDGVANDTASVSNALKSAGGGLVYFPRGTYLCSTLYPTNGTTIAGDGPSSVIKLYAPGVNTVLIQCGANSVNLSNLALNGGTNTAFNTVPVSTSATGIIHYATSSAIVDNVSMEAFQCGLFVNGANDIGNRNANAMYSFNVITNCQFGLFLGDNNAAEYCGVIGNRVVKCYYGVINQSAANVLFSGNIVKDSSQGIQISPTSGRGHSLYTGNVINHNSIAATGAANSMFVGNEILGGAGISLTSCSNFVFADNGIEVASITFSGGATNIFRNNTFIGTPSLSGNTTNNFLPLGQNYQTGVGLLWQ